MFQYVTIFIGKNTLQFVVFYIGKKALQFAYNFYREEIG